MIFQSFQSGNLKQLDLEFYLRLRLPTTKRMFRFLDKRFYRRARLDFDLRTLACEHIGMSRSYAPTELKRRLKPALEELEQLGFLEPLSPEERYSYVKRGCWRIILIRGRAAQSEPVPARAVLGAGRGAEGARGHGEDGRRAGRGAPAGRIQTKIEVFDWLMRNEDKRVGKNPAGYLVASIRSDYQAPERLPSRRTSPAKAQEVERSAGEAKRQEQQHARAEADRDQAREAELRAAWERLPEAEREAILAAVKAENPGLSRWRKMLEPLCLAALEARLKNPRRAQPTLFPET